MQVHLTIQEEIAQKSSEISAGTEVELGSGPNAYCNLHSQNTDSSLKAAVELDSLLRWMIFHLQVFVSFPACLRGKGIGISPAYYSGGFGSRIDSAAPDCLLALDHQVPCFADYTLLANCGGDLASCLQEIQCQSGKKRRTKACFLPAALEASGSLVLRLKGKNRR